MTTKNDGGPAFPPHGGETLYHRISDGMSLRDWFAGQALAGLVANANLLDFLDEGQRPVSDKDFASVISKGAYFYADAMLAERSKP
jgi:hypothetical protein